jgi:alpha-D-ribose 1-methylphosphonate 5-triphosphate synthase subunit PhnH
MSIAAEIAPGFEDTVHDTQRVFRRALEAFAHPGRVVAFEAKLMPPSPLLPTAGALALTLFDHGTAVLLDGALDSEGVRQFLRFHCGAPLTADPAHASFALIGDAEALRLDTFAIGTPEAPERSTTAIVQVAGFDGAEKVRLSGPGIEREHSFAVRGLAPIFWAQWRVNTALFPMGVDVVFASPGTIAALPRSIKAEA